MPKVSTLPKAPPSPPPVDQIQAALQIVVGSITQIRVHERLLREAGVRLDRAGSALLSKLYRHGDTLRVTDLAGLLGVDAPTVTRKIQQLEKQGLVSRHPDPDDRRATRIDLTRTGKQTLERVLAAKRKWFDSLVEGWDDTELETFATLLGRFASAFEQDLEDTRVC